MPQEGFEEQNETTRAPVGPDELRLVLHDLSHNEVEETRATRELPEDHVTAQAISETLDIPIAQVYEAIARVRRSDVREHVSKVLSELEEPTHRVERPGHAKQDPLMSHYGFRRENIFSSILDKLPRPERSKHVESKRPEQTDKRQSAIGSVILWLFMTGFIATTVYVTIVILQQAR